MAWMKHLDTPLWRSQPDRGLLFSEAGLFHRLQACVTDVTSVWLELLRRKNFLDMTGNGVNHPNDFAHRIYAQVILAME